jgi:peptidoglycan/LPS O-acetylase OafA/YrhL
MWRGDGGRPAGCALNTAAIYLLLTAVALAWVLLRHAGPAADWGLRSYRLHALHFPVRWLVYAAGAAVGLAAHERLAVMLGLALPVSVLMTWPVCAAVEQPARRRVRAVGVTRSA